MTRKYHQPCPTVTFHPMCIVAPQHAPAERRRFLRAPRRHHPTGLPTSPRLAAGASTAKHTLRAARPRPQPHSARAGPLATAGRPLANRSANSSPTTLPRPHRYRQAGRVRLHRSRPRRRFAWSSAVSAIFLGKRTPSVAAWVASPSRRSARTPVGSSGSTGSGHTSARLAPRTKSSLAPSRCSWSSNPRASVGSAVACPPAAMARLGQRIPATTALEQVTHDGGTGLANGLACQPERASRRTTSRCRRPTRSLSHVAEGGRVLRKTQAGPAGLDGCQLRQESGSTRPPGSSTDGLRHPRRCSSGKGRGRLPPMGKGGHSPTIRQGTYHFRRLNSLVKGDASCGGVGRTIGRGAVGQVQTGRRPETYAYLDRLKGKSEALPVSEVMRETRLCAQQRGIRQHPELEYKEKGQRAGVLRGLLLVWSVLIPRGRAEAGQQAVSAFGQAVRYAGEGVQLRGRGSAGVVRMQQSRHRKMSQGLLDLKRLYWNLRKFRTGGRKKTSPYERLGVPVPANLSWCQLLQLTPEQLRPLLSAQPRWLHEKVP